MAPAHRAIDSHVVCDKHTIHSPNSLHQSQHCQWMTTD